MSNCWQAITHLRATFLASLFYESALHLKPRPNDSWYSLKPHYFFYMNRPFNTSTRNRWIRWTKPHLFKNRSPTIFSAQAPCPLGIALKIVAIKKKKSARRPPRAIIFLSPYPPYDKKGNLSNDDDDDDGDFDGDGNGNEKGKEAIGSDWQNNNSARITLFCTLPSLHDYDEKIPNFTFCGGRELKTTTFFFFSWTSIQSFRIQLQTTFDELNEMK